MKADNTLLLRFEAATLFCLSLFLFHYFDYSWKLFAFLILLPDIGFAGYSFGSKIGAIAYNLLHLEMMPALLTGYALYTNTPKYLPVALIWFCHICFDRMCGIGLKEFKGFKHTHLGQLK